VRCSEKGAASRLTRSVLLIVSHTTLKSDVVCRSSTVYAAAQTRPTTFTALTPPYIYGRPMYNRANHYIFALWFFFFFFFFFFFCHISDLHSKFAILLHIMVGPVALVRKSFLYRPILQRLLGVSGRTISGVQKSDGQTGKQKQRFWPPRRRVKSKLHQTWRGDRGPRVCSCTSKTVGAPTYSFAVRGHRKSGGKRPSQLKIPITP